MKVIYLFLNKGGTGRTSSIFNLSWVLSEKFNKRILVIDMDPECNLTSLFNINLAERSQNGLPSIAHCLLKQLNLDGKRKSIKECIEHIPDSNIDIAVSSFELSQANVFMLNEINRINLLKNALNEIKDDYDYAFVDTGSANDQLFLNSINIADLVIPTVKTNFLEINNLSMLESTLEELQQEGIKPDVNGVLCTISDNTIHDKQCVDYLNDNGYNILGIIKKQIAVPDSNLASLPVFKFNKTKQAALEYENVARKILDYFGDK